MKSPSRGTVIYWATVAACLVLLFARRTDNLFYPQFWAEGGTLYYQDAFNNEGAASLLFKSDDGYLNVFPRLIGILGVLFPMAMAPLFFNLAAFVVQALALFYLAGRRSDPYLPTWRLKAAVCLLYVCLPNSSETYVNVANSSWYLLVAALLVVLSAPPRSGAVRLCDLVVLGLCALTGPVALFLFPILLYRIVFHYRNEEAKWGAVAAMVIGVGIAAQLTSLIVTPRFGDAPAAFATWYDLVSAVSLNTVYKTVLGSWVTASPVWWFRLTRVVAGVAVIAWLAVMTLRSRSFPLVSLFLVALAITATGLAFPLYPMDQLLRSIWGSRYFLLAALWVAVTLIHLSLAPTGFSRYPARLLLAILVLVGIPTDFVHFPLPDSAWPLQVRAYQGLPPGGRYSFQVNPGFHPPMTLKTGAAGERRSDLLAGLVPSPGEPQYEIDAFWEFRMGPLRMMRVSGEIEETTGRGRGALVIMAGSIPYIASMEHRVGSTYFFRHIPIEELAGRITLDLLWVDFETGEYSEL